MFAGVSRWCDGGRAVLLLLFHQARRVKSTRLDGVVDGEDVADLSSIAWWEVVPRSEGRGEEVGRVSLLLFLWLWLCK